MNLPIACISVVILRNRAEPARDKPFIALVLAFNGFWGAGYFAFSGITNTGDWEFVLRDLQLEPAWLWRAAMRFIGVLLYVTTMRLAAPWLPRGRSLVFAYLSAGLVACLSTLFFAGEHGPAIREAAQESLLAALGLLFLAVKRKIPSDPSLAVSRSRRIQVFGLVLTVVFWLTLGHGIRVA